MAVFEDSRELSVSEVVKYLELKGGRSTNHELVSQFRKFLNDPARKVEARLQFKDIVNTVANVQEEEGIKYIALKRKYSSSSICTADDTSSIDSNSSHSQQTSPPRYSSPFNQGYQPYWRYRLSCDRPLGQPVAFTGPRRYSYDAIETQSLPVSQARSSPDLSESGNSEERRNSLTSEEPIYENTSSLIYQNRLLNNSGYMKQKAVSIQELQKNTSRENSIVPHQTGDGNNYICYKSNSIDMQPGFRPNSHMPVTISQSLPDGGIHQAKNVTNEAFVYSSLSLQMPPQEPLPCHAAVREYTNTNDHVQISKEPEVFQSAAMHQKVDANKPIKTHNSIDEPKVEEMKRKTSLGANEFSSAPIAPPRRRDTAGKEIRRSESEGNINQQSEIKKESPTDAELQQLNLNSGSVMERVQKLDRLSTEVTGKRSVGSPLIRSRKRENRNEKANEEDLIYISLDSKTRKKWFLAAAKCDYHTLVALLKDLPKLASLKDITSGFTALHWAAKHGNSDVIKLIAGAHRVNPNIRSNGGYTPIHIATMYKHKSIVDLLIKTYGADATLRDHSGKRADQYPDGYVSRIAGFSRPSQTPSKRKEFEFSTPSPSLVPRDLGAGGCSTTPRIPKTVKGRPSLRTAIHQSFIRKSGKRPEIYVRRGNVKSYI